MIRSLGPDRITFREKNVVTNDRAVKAETRINNAKLLGSELQRRYQSEMPEGFWVHVHVYSVDPLIIGKCITQQPDPPDDWPPKREEEER